MFELTFVPDHLQHGRTQTKIVRCLMPFRTMLGRRFQVQTAQRLGPCQWQITFAKHWLFGWSAPPLLEKSFVDGAKEYVYVRQVEIVYPHAHMPPGVLGPDCRVLGFSNVVPPYYPHPEMLSRYVRRVQYLSALNWRDGLMFLPDETCINPRGGPIQMVPTTPEQIEGAKSRLEKYLVDRQANADGKIFYCGSWMTPAEFQKTKKFEEANPLR
jgi:hypothetical protein